MKSVVLIGMPGAGKSTAGVILAKVLGRKFIDTDLVIQEESGRLLQEIIDTQGPEAFLDIEEKTVLSRDFSGSVVATGGSVVFSKTAMAHLKAEGIVVYLKISYKEMVHRLTNITTRGIVLPRGQGLREMYDERAPLYGKYADITVDCTGGDFEEIVKKILAQLARHGA